MGMWAKLRFAKPEDGVLMPNWGSEEPPRWLIICGPLSVVTLSVLFTGRHDIMEQVKDYQALRNGGWPCPECLIINEAASTSCSKCQMPREGLPFTMAAPPLRAS